VPASELLVARFDLPALLPHPPPSAVLLARTETFTTLQALLAEAKEDIASLRSQCDDLARECILFEMRAPTFGAELETAAGEIEALLASLRVGQAYRTDLNALASQNWVRTLAPPSFPRSLISAVSWCCRGIGKGWSHSDRRKRHLGRWRRTESKTEMAAREIIGHAAFTQLASYWG